jgi:hypothetical protein
MLKEVDCSPARSIDAGHAHEKRGAHKFNGALVNPRVVDNKKTVEQLKEQLELRGRTWIQTAISRWI